MPKRHLGEWSDRWNNIFTSFSFEISTWMVKEMTHLKSWTERISVNSLSPASAAGWLFAWFEGRHLAFFRTRAVLFTMAFPRKKRDRFEVKISPFWLDGVIVCTPSGPILDEFPQRPSRYYFALNRKLIFDRAFVSFTWQSFFIQSTSWSQDGDMIIHMSWNEKRKDR